MSLEDAGVTTGTALGSGNYPGGQQRGGTLGPYSGQSYSRGPGRINSESDGGAFLEGNPSRTSPTSFCGAYTISSCRVTIIFGVVRSA